MIEQSTDRIEKGRIRYGEFENKFVREGDISSLRSYGLVDSTGKLIEFSQLKALFLGIKPSVKVVEPNLNVNFGEYGLNQVGSFIYNDVLVEQVVAENPDVFGSTISDIENLFKTLDNPNVEDRNLHLKIGLLLGFPSSSCEWFNNRTLAEFVGKIQDSVSYGVGGVRWSGPQGSIQDLKHEKILKKSFVTNHKSQ